MTGVQTCALPIYEKAPEGFRYVYIRAFNFDRECVPQLEKDLQAVGKMIYMVDHRDNVREVFDVQ